MSTLKEQIQSLYTKTGKVNTAVIRQNWFKESQLYNDVIIATSFLPKDVSVSQRLCCIEQDITSTPICPMCQSRIRNFLPQGYYSITCADKECISANPLLQNKRLNTMIQKYGSKVSPKSRQAASERAIEFNKKAAETVKTRYGIDNVSQLEFVKEKKKQTFRDNWGTDFYSQSEYANFRTLMSRYEKMGVKYYTHSLYPDAYKLLENKDWLYNEYVTQRKPADVISQELGFILPYQLNGSQVHLYLDRHNIEKRKCSGYSYKSIKWLESIMLTDNIYIQHGANEGEYNIPTTRYYVDGYCKQTNTIYEFHGDVYHGNLKVFAEEYCCHPFKPTITAKQLYEDTVKREGVLRDLGYNVITMWELDWDNRTTHKNVTFEC